MVGFSSGRAMIAICDRCRLQFPYGQLRPDGDIPALRVCGRPQCLDAKDPWRLPPHQLEALSVRYPRPDVPLAIPPNPYTEGEVLW